MATIPEQASETAICDSLASLGRDDADSGGNADDSQPDFSTELGLDTAELFTFIGDTRHETWGKVAPFPCVARRRPASLRHTVGRRARQALQGRGVVAGFGVRRARADSRGFFTVDGDNICRVDNDPSNHPVYERKDDDQIVWRWIPVGTEKVDDPTELDHIIAWRWGSS